jgi:vesicle-fusing ATPase
MRSNGMLAPDVDLGELASLAKNYTGAEIEGVVDSASSFALNREVDMENLTKELTGDSLVITRADFLRAFQETPPAFGVDQSEFDGCALNGIIDFGTSFSRLHRACAEFITQVQKSDRTPIISVLLHGDPGCGKTSLAAMLAQRSGFPFCKFMTPEKMIGLTDQGKMDRIRRIFEDAYKSPFSVIVADDVERLINYAPMGPIFSNQLLQTLLVTFKKAPPSGRKLIIFATTSCLSVLSALGLADVFTHTLRVPNVETPAEVSAVLRSLGGWSDVDANAAAKSVGEVPIKKLIAISEMAIQSSEEKPLIVRFETCLDNFGMGANMVETRNPALFSLPGTAAKFPTPSFSSTYGGTSLPDFAQ